MSDDDPPADVTQDLDQLERGHEVTVHYQSNRSGNEVDRSGTVASVTEADSGPQVRVHVEERGAFSMTAAADPDVDEPPRIGRLYSYRFETERTSVLGAVNRVVKEGSGAFFSVVYEEDE